MAAQTDKLCDGSQPTILRIAAASYLASFLVRSDATGLLAHVSARDELTAHFRLVSTGARIVPHAGVCAAAPAAPVSVVCFQLQRITSVARG